MMGRLSPCKGCEKRNTPKCYSECESYLAFRAERELIQKKHKEAVMFNNYEMERNRRIKKRMR